MNSLVDKKAMDDGCFAIRRAMTSTEESDRHKVLALNVLKQALDDIARDGHKTSGGEKLLRGLGRNLGRNLERTLESEQLCAVCTNSLLLCLHSGKLLSHSQSFPKGSLLLLSPGRFLLCYKGSGPLRPQFDVFLLDECIHCFPDLLAT